MTGLNYVGGGSPAVSISYTDRWVSTASGVALPTTGTLAANGNRPIYVATAACFWAGRGANRQLALSIGGASSGWVTVGSASSASYSGQLGIGAVFPNGGTQSVRIDSNGVGSFYFGRASGSGSVDSYGTSFGALSGSLEYYEVPTAPTIGTVTQAALENAVNVTWSAPSSNGGSAITSYTLQWSYNSDMSSPTTISTGSTATSYKITGLTYGSIVYVKVAAVNIVATANATTSVFSSVANGYITPPDLPLNGWANFGTLANNTFALKRTSIPALIPTTGIQRTATSTATGGSYTTGNFGIEKTYTDLIVGRQYVVSGKAILLTASRPGNIYRFAVNGIGNGSSVTLTSTTVGATIPSYTFTATATSHTIQIELAETFTVTTVGKQEDVAFYDFALTRTAVDLAYRLQDNMENTSLRDHFDLATQSVGAYWWVDKLNTTQFTQNFNYVAPTCIFSDVVADGNLYYNDIEVAYDTSTLVNQVTFNNIGKRASTYGSGNYESYEVEWVDTDATSVANWGARKQELTTNLYTAVDKINLYPNPTVAYNMQGMNSYRTSLNRFQISAIANGATGNLATGTTSPAAGVGDWVIRAQLTANQTEWGVQVMNTDNKSLDVTGSVQYTFSAYQRAGVGHATGVTGKVQINWHDNNYSFISASIGSSTTITSSGWTRSTVTATAPANAALADIYSIFNVASGTNTNFKYYTTGFQLEQSASASVFFSGDKTDDATYVYEWDGTPGASRSIRYLNQMDTRTGELLTALSTPIVRVNKLKWNTAQNPVTAATLDIGSLVTVTFKGTTATYRVVGITHDITPDRWMMELEIAKV